LHTSTSLPVATHGRSGARQLRSGIGRSVRNSLSALGAANAGRLGLDRGVAGGRLDTLAASFGDLLQSYLCSDNMRGLGGRDHNRAGSGADASESCGEFAGRWKFGIAGADRLGWDLRDACDDGRDIGRLETVGGFMGDIN
jgi:hypothetical protein